MKFRYLVAAVSAVLSLAQADIVSKGNVEIRRIAKNGPDGSIFLYFPSGLITQCDRTVWGENFGVVKIPNNEMYAQILTAKTSGLTIRQLIVNTSAGNFEMAWTGPTSCVIDYLVIE